MVSTRAVLSSQSMTASGELGAYTLIAIFNWFLFILLFMAFIVILCFKTDVSTALALRMAENVDNPDWSKLAQSFFCCPNRPKRNSTGEDLHCCAEHVYDKYSMKSIFPMIAMLVFLAGSVINCVCCRNAVHKRRREKQKQRFEKEEELFKKRKEKMEEDFKKEKEATRKKLEKLKKKEAKRTKKLEKTRN